MPSPTDVNKQSGLAGVTGVGDDIADLVVGLEPAQREAVLADDPVVCVLAGAGTGKTRVLTIRVARRVMDGTAHPTHVLVCTFSRKAADELRDRLWLLGVGSEVRAGTFHRTALRVIAHRRLERGQSPPVVVADRRPLLAELLEGGGGAARGARSTARSRPPRRAPARHLGEASRLDAEIGWAKSRLVGPSGYEEAARAARRRASIPAGKVAELYALYEVARHRRGAFDLDDLLWHCGDLLEEDAGFSRSIRWWHRHLFVDEMQDLNDAQYRLLRLLVGEEPDLFVVGDPNQSVYGWNGADPALLQRVTEEFAGTRVVRLQTNHRCAAPVVKIAAAALGESASPPSARGDGPLPAVQCLADDDDEARWVARKIWLAHRPGRRWSSIAVLARTNAQLTRVAAALEAEHVAYRISGGELGPASDVRVPRKGTDADPAGDAGASEDTDTDGEAGGTADARVPHARTAPADADDDAVVLSTFHRAKGLQWRTVFVIGVSDGLVPLVTARSSAARAEERRLFYVALTRAEEELACTWALRSEAASSSATASSAAGAAERRPSPWLASVERVLDGLREDHEEAGPARAAEHLSRMRALLPRQVGAGPSAP
jgi:DNA helicase-2/ATP-dependent DNA helicase PcrA